MLSPSCVAQVADPLVQSCSTSSAEVDRHFADCDEATNELSGILLKGATTDGSTSIADSPAGTYVVALAATTNELSGILLKGAPAQATTGPEIPLPPVDLQEPDPLPVSSPASSSGDPMPVCVSTDVDYQPFSSTAENEAIATLKAEATSLQHLRLRWPKNPLAKLAAQ